LNDGSGILLCPKMPNSSEAEPQTGEGYPAV
jgi:hypothetical protein